MNKLISVCLGLFFAFSLYACNSESYSSNKTTSEVTTSKYPGKVHAPIDMHFSTQKSYSAGENASIALTFKPGKSADNLEINIHTDDGLILMDTSNHFLMGAQNKNQKSNLVIIVNPERNGYFYINITATLVIGNVKESRIFAIPINVGNVDVQLHMKPAGIVQEDPTGQKIISMPASQPPK